MTALEYIEIYKQNVNGDKKSFKRHLAEFAEAYHRHKVESTISETNFRIEVQNLKSSWGYTFSHAPINYMVKGMKLFKEKLLVT